MRSQLTQSNQFWLLLLAGLLATAGRATTVIPPSFDEMVDRAELIFLGEVLNSRGEWRTVGTNRVIFTYVDFRPQEILKGAAGATVKLQFLGGTVEDTTLEIAGVPKFERGDRVILFVEGNGVRFCPLVGVFHGKFAVQQEAKTGRDIVLMYHGRPLRDVAEIGAGEGAEFGKKRPRVTIAADREPMSLDIFKSKIRQRLPGLGVPK